MKKFIIIGLSGLFLFILPFFCRSADRRTLRATSLKETATNPPVKDLKQRTTPDQNEIAFTNSLGMRFVKIPAGSFMMGSGISPSEVANRYGGKKEWYEEDVPLHRVAITQPFYMQTKEVTVGQWRSFIEETGYKTEAETDGGATILSGTKWERSEGYYWDNPGFKQTERNPVTCISWNDAQAFIKWLKRKEGKRYRLPTEAEWEYACRAGSTARFFFGDDIASLGKYAWYSNNSDRHSHPVGEKEANSWDLYDMHGNVWEWCQDWYGKYPSASDTDPAGPSSGSARVFRGGSAYSRAQFCRAAYRGGYQPDGRFASLGFRLILVP